MTRLLLVALGGALGAVARVLLSGALPRPSGFPLGTLAVNVLGCLAAGAFLAHAEARGSVTEDARAFLVSGVLGGFTTFSAFGGETFGLWRAGETGLAAANAGANLILGFGAVWAGHKALA